MRAAVAWMLCLAPLITAAGDAASVRIIPETLSPGEPFRMEIAITSTDDFPGPALRLSNELPALEAIPLRFSGQRMFSGNATTLLVSGVAPEAPGDYTIPGFTATMSVRKVEIPATRLTVKPAPSGTVNGFARFSIEIPDRPFYVGENLTARVVIEPGERERVAGFYGIDARGEGLVCRNQGQVGRGGEGPLRADVEVTPTQAGSLELRVGGMALVESGGSSGSTRDRPFLFVRKLRVAHVPERDRPADWAGAVGLLVSGGATVSNPKPGIGEPTTLTLTIKGKGNLDRVLAPEVPHGDAWDVQSLSTPAGNRLPGQRSFAYTLIPRLPGKLLTPAVRLSSFNPETAKFERIEFAPIEVNVTGQAPAKVELVAIDPAAPTDASAQAAARATELADPQADTGHGAASLPWLARPGALLWTQLAAAILLSVALAWAARRDWLARHPGLVRRRAAVAALRTARRRLRKAERSGDADRHAHAAVEGLRAGAAPLVDASDRALTAEDVLRAAPGIPGHDAVRAAFRRADGTRFGGQPTADTLGRHADLERCLAHLESHLCD